MLILRSLPANIICDSYSQRRNKCEWMTWLRCSVRLDFILLSVTDNIRQRINLVEITVVCLEYVNKSIQLKGEGKFSIKIISMLIALNIFMCSKCMKNQYPQNMRFLYACKYTDSWTLMHTKITCVVFNSYLDTVAWLKSAFSEKTTEAWLPTPCYLICFPSISQLIGFL